ncbi:MAG: hypothetical protein JWO59_2874, partial [Chloroflexi bacterium]|nr:hypothetical protein [Chloroflexota bacterium]
MAGATDSELHALQMENARLRAALAARVQENETLLQMIGDVVSTLKLERVLHQIVVHLESSFNCNAVFVYLIEQDQTQLVMRAASERYSSSVGRISMSMDEGLAGWSARTGEPTMIPEGATSDPRFRYFAELEEERFQAMLTVPICGPDSTVVAVIAMHTVAPQEFTTEHVRIVAAMAPILGSAIESSRLYEQTSRKLGVLSILSTLGQEVRSGRSLEDALAALVATIGQATGADRCALLLLEPGA